MKQRVTRLIKVLGAKAGLGAWRDAFLDLEIVSRISLRFAGHVTSATSPGTSDRSFPPFVGDADLWVQPGDRIERPGDATFGWDVQRLRADALALITESSRPGSGHGATEIRCSATSCLAPDSEHVGLMPATRGYVTCDARSLVIDFAGLYPTRTTRYRPRHRRGPGRSYHRYRAGALTGDCRWQSTFTLDTMPRDLLRDIFGSFRPWTGTSAVPHDEVVEHPVLFVTREGDENRNAFHAMTDFVNAFETMLIAGDVPRQELEVVLLDNAEPSWLDAMWPRAFAPGRGVRRVGDFNGKRVLFRRALFNAPGYQSFLFGAYLTRPNQRPEPVGMLDAFSALVLRSSGLVPTAPRRDGPLRITFVSRRPYHQHEWTGRQVVNEAACVAALAAIGNVAVRVVDFAEHSLDGQIGIARETDLLIGAHGAALTHMLWTPNHAGVIEILPINGHGWRMFPNMATWTGRPYASVDAPERIREMGTDLTVDEALLTRTARELIADVRRRGSIS